MVRSERPHFHNAAEWLKHYENACSHGANAWPPATRDELVVADENRLFDLHPEWLPSVVGLQLLNLPEWFSRQVEPLDEIEQERLLVTMQDTQFCRAFHRLLMKGVTG